MSITPDILNDNCDSLISWITIASQGTNYFVIDNGYHIYSAGTDVEGSLGCAKLLSVSTLPDLFTTEIKIKNTKLAPQIFLNNFVGYSLQIHLDDEFHAYIAFLLTQDGVYLFDINSAENYVFFPGSSGMVSYGESAVEQTWRLQYNATNGWDSIEVELFLNGISLGKITTNNRSQMYIPEVLYYILGSFSGIADEQESYVTSIKIGTGLGSFAGESTVQTLTPSNITQSNFVANGRIDSIGEGITIVKRGFCYKVKE